MKRLYLEDLAGLTQAQVAKHISKEYEVPLSEVNKFKILIAYESVGSWGCDSNSWFLLQDRKTNKLYETHGSHCSCYGFEGQFEPEETTLEYLNSDKFYFSTGGYDNDDAANKAAVKEYLKSLVL